MKNSSMTQALRLDYSVAQATCSRSSRGTQLILPSFPGVHPLECQKAYPSLFAISCPKRPVRLISEMGMFSLPQIRHLQSITPRFLQRLCQRTNFFIATSIIPHWFFKKDFRRCFLKKIRTFLCLEKESGSKMHDFRGRLDDKKIIFHYLSRRGLSENALFDTFENDSSSTKIKNCRVKSECPRRQKLARKEEK